MKKVKLTPSRQPIPVLIELAKRMYMMMSANVNFQNLPANFNDLSTQAALAETNYIDAKATNIKQDYAALKANVADLRVTVRSIGCYIDMVAQGNEQIIFSAGVEATKDRVKDPVPEMVQEVTAIFTNNPATIDVQWRGAKYARSYDLFITTNPYITNGWTLVASTTKKKLLVENLTSGTRYYFRVIAIGTAGASAPSEYVSGMTMCNALPA